ncbi:MAG TPA: hypothetical protein PLN21_16325 [Gemmatales bacterium]|nr:hypothetical protein [Gemmatales bacterium]
MSIVLSSRDVTDHEMTQLTVGQVSGQHQSTEVPPDRCRWLTIISPDLSSEVELAMEPDQHPAAKPFKMAIIHEGSPFATFGTAEYQRLQEAGVQVTQPPMTTGSVATAVFYDTCGNLFQMTQKL